MKRIFILIFLVIFSSFSYSAGQKVIRYNLEGGFSTLDPQMCTDSNSGNVLAYIFEGLTRLDYKGKPIPAIAESWSNNGNTWTFKLRKNAKWQNGDPVVAKDFLDAWERVLNPNSEAEYSYIMYCIKGAQEYNEGISEKFSSVGIKALDNFTLQVTLNKPIVYFPNLVSLYTFYPQNTKFLKENNEYGEEANSILGNGAFTVSNLDNYEEITLKKSENYWNKNSIKINTIEIYGYDRDEALKKYDERTLDIVEIPYNKMNFYKKSKDLRTFEDGSFWYLGLNNEKPLLSNKKIRKALSMAINREKLVNDIKNSLASEAESIVPMGIKGKVGFFRNEYNQSLYDISYNPQKARELFEEGLKELKLKKSEIGYITLLAGNNDNAIRESEFYAEQLKMNLGLEIELENTSFQIRLQKTIEKDYDMVLSGWGPDYNDPMTYLDMWTSNSGQNNTGWGNKTYDTLIESAVSERDYSKRMDILAQAEKLLMDELPIIPIYYRKTAFLVKPNINNLEFSLFSPIVNFTYSDIK